MNKLKEIPMEILFFRQYLNSLKLKLEAKDYLIKGDGSVDQKELKLFIDIYKHSYEVDKNILDKLYYLYDPNFTERNNMNTHIFFGYEANKKNDENEKDLYIFIERLKIYDSTTPNFNQKDLVREWKECRLPKLIVI